MATSQNGWPAHNETSRFVRSEAAGLKFWAASDDVAYLAAYLIRRFHAEVERIDGPILDDWSWADRNVRNSATEVSNHASATAWDLNALKHPRGVQNTFTKAQIAAVNTILDVIIDDRGVRIFRWGENYVRSPVDGMHFEVNVPASSVRQAVIRLKKLEQKEQGDMPLSDSDISKIAKKVWEQAGRETIPLTDAAADAMSLDDIKRAKGNKVSLGYFFQWGGPGLFRITKQLREVHAQQREILALLKKK